jgi:hypothetical protein
MIQVNPINILLFSTIIKGKVLTNMICLFCNLPEPNYKLDPQVDFICGGCVILLADAGQEDLKKACQKALDEKHLSKVSALESFIIPEEKYGRRPDKSVKRNLNRKRAARSIRNQKRLSQPVEA